MAKKRHIAAKLLPKDGATALDIGCGFGGMGLYLAGVAGAKVTGVTLSSEQFTDRDRSSPSGRPGRPGRISASGLPRRS